MEVMVEAQLIVKRFTYCEQCGGDKPWARTDWIMEFGFAFCSRYCVGNYEAFLRRLWRKGKKVRLP